MLPHDYIPALTPGTMTVVFNQRLRGIAWAGFRYTNAMIVALGASLTGDITVCTLPARTVILNSYLVVESAATNGGTLTMAVGRTAAAYVDYIGASDIKAVANTVYGDTAGERGANLTGYDMPSYTATTAVVAHCISTVVNLSTTTTAQGMVWIAYTVLPS